MSKLKNIIMGGGLFAANPCGMTVEDCVEIFQKVLPLMGRRVCDENK